MQILAATQLDRGARRVQRGHLRVAANCSQSKAAFLLEEALRLAHLPGEDQGCVYYFRSVSIPRIPFHASRGVWLAAIQNELSSLAEQAVHATDPRAGSANAVFFNHAHEAISLLFQRVLRGAAPGEWFWSFVSGRNGHTTAAAKIVALVEQLRQEPASWNAIAEMVLSSLDSYDPAVLLDSLPPSVIQNWLRELDRASGTKPNNPLRKMAPLEISVVSGSAKRCGWNDPRTVWLTSLAVIRSSGSDWSHVAAVSQARSVLQILASRECPVSEEQSAGLPFRSGMLSPYLGLPEDAPTTLAPATSNLGVVPRKDGLQKAHDRDFLKGAAHTNAGGFLFLLNALRRLGVERTLQEFPALLENQFLPHLLLSLARHAGIAARDPILLWAKDITLEQESFAPEPSIPPDLYDNPRAWPANLPFTLPANPAPASLVRAWLLGVRRYCWRSANLTAREIARRPGWVLMRHGELDVALPMATIDIRIRRAGLDINPGWLPWFGWVVRFHYIESDSGPESC